MFHSATRLQRRQQGAATLIVVSVLAIAMALVALTISNTGIMEQRISGNDLRAREVQEAAEAGLNYGLAWARKHTIPGNPDAGKFVRTACPGDNNCPPNSDPIKGSSTGESYSYDLEYFKYPKSIKVVATAFPVNDAGKKSDDSLSLSAKSETFIKQVPKTLFRGGVTMPPPWVINGCVAKLTGNPNMVLLSADSKAMVTSLVGVDLSTMLGASVLSPQGLLNAALKLCLNVTLLGIHLGVQTSLDANVLDKNGNTNADLGTTIKLDQAKNTDSFKCDPPGDAHCAWREFFDVKVDTKVDTKVDVGAAQIAAVTQIAIDANQVFNEKDQIPCGPAISVSVYVVNKKNPINPADMTGDCGDKDADITIGSLEKPVVMIVPADNGCPGFNGGITVYGIIYFESTALCKNNGWGDAKIFGSVIWEGDMENVNANPVFVEVDYAENGSLDEVFNIGPDDAVNLPGTWKDF